MSCEKCCNYLPSAFVIDSGDPNGFIEADSQAFVYTRKGVLWTKTNLTFDSAGWVNVIADGP
jgi:hypothetical protein